MATNCVNEGMNDTSPIYVYVDVDDTLVRSSGGARIPVPDVIKHVRALFDAGAILYCWSAGGAEYAKQTAKDLGIADCFKNFLPKPNVLIDDQELSNWPRCITVHPASCGSMVLDGHRTKIKGNV
jgi:hypothetical protein